jgi:hypothetical protein
MWVQTSTNIASRISVLEMFYRSTKIKVYVLCQVAENVLIALLENLWTDHCVNRSFCSGTTMVGF